MEQKQYWNTAADTKEFTTPFQVEEFSKFVDISGIILDIGCGYGRTLEQLHKGGYHNLIGIDFSKAMIERGKEKYPYLDLRLKRTESIEMLDESCDAVILLAVLTCIVSDNEQLLLLKEIKRVLKPGGILYINDFLLNSDERNIKRYEQFKNKYNKYGVFELPEGAIVRHHNIKWVEESLKIFKKNAFEKLIYTTMNGNKSNGYYYIGEKIQMY